MSNWQTKLEDFACDLLTLIEDQIGLAETDPASHQRATVAECGAAITVLKKRLDEDDFEKTKAMLIYNPLYTGHWLSEWNSLATAPVSKFLEGAGQLLKGAGLLKAHFELQSKP